MKLTYQAPIITIDNLTTLTACILTGSGEQSPAHATDDNEDINSLVFGDYEFSNTDGTIL